MVCVVVSIVASPQGGPGFESTGHLGPFTLCQCGFFPGIHASFRRSKTIIYLAF